MAKKLAVTLLVVAALLVPPLVSNALNATDTATGQLTSHSTAHTSLATSRNPQYSSPGAQAPSLSPGAGDTLGARRQTPTPTPTRRPTRTPTPTPRPTRTPTPTPRPSCPLGGRASGQSPAALAAAEANHPGSYYQVIDYVDSRFFAQLPRSIRALRAESLADMQATGEQALADGLPYEALVYDLEGWDQTPVWEQQNQVEATRMARDIAHSFGKLLVMAPARAFTWRNWPAMAPYADMWVIQAQAGQRTIPAGPQFTNWLAPYVGYLSTHPDMPIWAQLTTYPERTLTMDEYFAYVNSVYPSLVDGVYVFNPNQALLWANVFSRACPW